MVLLPKIYVEKAEQDNQQTGTYKLLYSLLIHIKDQKNLLIINYCI